MERVDAIIAGVNKAGTTSLFVSLSEHPDVAPSAIKETRYFLPARYGRPVGARDQWEGYFRGRDEPVRLEATPSYFYGGTRVAHAMADVLERPRAIVVLREPVARAISFFEYQKVRLRFAPEVTIEEYLERADALGDADFDDPENEKYMAVRGGRYADWLPEWWETLGADAVKVLYFEDLVADGPAVLRDVAGWLGLDPAGLSDELRSENRTTAYKRARFQAIALRVNDGSERLLRRVPRVKRAVRSLYFRLNGRPETTATVSDAVRADLAGRFVEPNGRLAVMLVAQGLQLPPWLLPTPHRFSPDSETP